MHTTVDIKTRFLIFPGIRSNNDLLSLNAQFSLESRENYTLLELSKFKHRRGGSHALEFFFLLPPKSLCKRFSNHPRNSVGSPCCSNRNFPALARFTSCRNSCGLTWLLNRRGFQSFFASPANRFRSSDSLPRKLESRRKLRNGGMCRREWMMTFMWSFLLILLRPTYPGR